MASGPRLASLRGLRRLKAAPTKVCFGARGTLYHREFECPAFDLHRLQAISVELWGRRVQPRRQAGAEGALCARPAAQPCVPAPPGAPAEEAAFAEEAAPVAKTAEDNEGILMR